LGLSLSYYIVKAYGGQLKVERKEEEGNEFVVELPIIFFFLLQNDFNEKNLRYNFTSAGFV
jgi:K+-sensing histidine kinase KdpD